MPIVRSTTATIAIATTAALAAALAGAPVRAASFASSTASASSQSGSASLGSVSNSFEASSDGARRAAGDAAGDYRVAAIDDAPGRPGVARIVLQAVADAAIEYRLYVPQPTVSGHRLDAGQIVRIEARPYGWAFAAQATGQPFFIAVADDWLPDLQTRPLGG